MDLDAPSRSYQHRGAPAGQQCRAIEAIRHGHLSHHHSLPAIEPGLSGAGLASCPFHLQGGERLSLGCDTDPYLYRFYGQARSGEPEAVEVGSSKVCHQGWRNLTTIESRLTGHKRDLEQRVCTYIPSC